MDLRDSIEEDDDDDDDDGDDVELDSISDLFFDALDALDSLVGLDNDETLSVSPSIPLSESVSSPIATSASPFPAPALRLRSRQLLASPSPQKSAPASNVPSLDSPAEKQHNILLSLKGQELDSDSPISALTSDQVSTGGGDPCPEVSLESGATNFVRDIDVGAVDAALLPPRSSLESAADLMIKAVFFQINLLIRFIKLPFWLLHCSFLVMTDPFGTLYQVINGATTRFLGALKGLFEKFLLLVFGRVTGQQEAGKMVARLAWGCFWSLYVCFMLFGLLAASFLGGSLITWRMVEEPVQMTEELNFDYTKPSPEALVPIASCDGCWVSGKNTGITSYDVLRVVPPNQKLQLTISLTLPESDYNRNLGIFQVRVELLTIDGNVTASSSQPCILRFKSSHIRHVETLLKSIFLLAGYSSESQVLRLRMRGLIEGTRPTVCVRVILEQRAEFRPGVGIPEIYSASMKLESELPLLKRIIWNWRRTMFIWTSMVLFVMQLLIVLVCCRPVIVPRARPNGGAPGTL